MITFDPQRDPLDVLAEEFAQRCRRGETPSVADYTGRYPELADQLRELLPAVAQMEELKRLRGNARGLALAGPRLERLGDYRIVREVGRGGMGIVYEAVEESLGRRVALKVLPASSLLDPKKLERFRREAQAAARLHHTNIVPIFGAGEQQGVHYFVMQFIEGRGLHAVVAAWRDGDGSDAPTVRYAKTPVTPAESAAVPDPDPTGVSGRSASADGSRWRRVARIAQQAAEALDYAHRQGTLHRDVKPSNLLLEESGIVWVADFGLAKLADQTDLTSTGDVVGTLQYMAPEVLHGQADARSDVYSLGLTLYELLTLRSPFEDAHPARMLQQVGHREPTRPRAVDPAIPRDLETIVLKATATEPARRYQTSKELADDLGRFLDDRPIHARRITFPGRLLRWCRRNKAIAGLSAALVAALLGGFVGMLWKWREANAAYQREAEQRGRAEDNLRLSLAAFEEIFERMRQRDQAPPFGPHPGGPGPHRAPPHGGSEDDAALLHSILTFYDRLAAQNATNAHLHREAARGYRRVSEVYQRLGQTEKAGAAYRRALAMLERLAQEFPAVEDYRLELAEACASGGPQVAGADGLREKENRLNQAIALGKGLTETPRRTALLAQVHGNLGVVLQQAGRAGEAETSYREGVRFRKALVDQFPGQSGYRLDLGIARYWLADFLLRRQRAADARGALEESIADLEALRRLDPRFPPTHQLLAAHYQELSAVLNRLGETRLAAEALRRARPGPPPPPPRGRGPRPDPGAPPR